MKKFFKSLFGYDEPEYPSSDEEEEGPTPPLFDLTNDPLATSSDSKPHQNLEDISKLITLKAKTSTKCFSRHDFEAHNSRLPFLVSLEVQDTESEHLRMGLDLVLVIDISASMLGEKLDLVKETLVFLLGELTERDRVCLIKFGSLATQITGFRRMSDENKRELKEIVDKEIRVAGCTNLQGALDLAFKAMLSRERENEGTAVFLLSDGEDTCGNSFAFIQKENEKWHQKMGERGFNYQIHSFGFGDDHDENVLSLVSNMTSGHFYYIKSNAHVDECFIDCLGYLISVVAKKVQIRIQLSPGFEIKELFSVSWQKTGEKEAVLNLQGLAVGKTLHFITEIGINSKEIQFKDQERVPVAEVSMKYEYNKKPAQIEEGVQVTFVHKETDKGEPDQEVEENYLKVIGFRVLEEAQGLYDAGRVDLAQGVLERYQKEVHENVIPTMGFKQTIGGHMKMSSLKNPKNMHQLRGMMFENSYNPSYDNYVNMNRGQERMRFKKKGF